MAREGARFFRLWPQRGDARKHTEVLACLAHQGCALCAEEEEAQNRYLNWFAIESHGQVETIRALQRAKGFCHRHAVLFQRTAPDWLLVRYYRILVTHALDTLSDNAEVSTDPCPVCNAQVQAKRRFVARLDLALESPEVYQHFQQSKGFCLRHLGEASEILSLKALDRAVRVLADGLSSAQVDQAALLLWGTGAPALAPVSCLQAEPEAPGSGCSQALSTLQQEVLRGYCPACSAAATTQWSYLTRLVIEVPEAEPYQWRASLELCREHAMDFSALAPPPVWSAFVERAREAGLGYLAGFAKAYSESPPARLPWPRRKRPRLEAAIKRLSRRWCQVCHEQAAASARSTTFLPQALTDEQTRQIYGKTLGTCFAHFITAPAEAHKEDSWKLVRAAMRSRLLVVAFELGEVERQSAWSARYENKLSVRAAWQRAARVYDGFTLGSA